MGCVKALTVATLVTTVFLVCSALEGPSFRHHHHDGLKLCVAYSQLSYCNQMVQSLARHHDLDSEKISCVGAPDKMSCINRIIHGDAIWMILGADELYAAQRYLPDGLVVLSEIRSEQYKTRDYRYSSVAVVRKSANISSIEDLRSKRSCHTGFGKTTGWRVPFSTLFVNRQLHCSRNASAAEADISAVSSYFSAACVPGSWVTDKAQDQLLKQKYSNLCSLCADPASCSKSDNYADYSGALRCLSENSGDVAWTKLDEAEKFAKDPAAADFELLCLDNTTQPLSNLGDSSTEPCTWAHRPWTTVVMTQHFAKNENITRALQQELSKFQEIAQKQSPPPEWLKKVLELHNETDVIVHQPVNLVKVQTPQAYLQPTGYSNTLWHPSCGISKKSLRICVYNQLAMERCEALKLAAMGAKISPGFSCLLAYGGYFCAQKVLRGEADIVISADGYHAGKIETTGLVPLLRTSLPTGKTTSEPYVYSLAVISSQIAPKFTDSLAPLQGLRSCHGDINSPSGWQVPRSVLQTKGLLTGNNCSLTEISEYFSGMCVPGAPQTDSNLCSICAGDGKDSMETKTPTPGTKCASNSNERYFGSDGALRCLSDNTADIAFIDHLTLLRILNRNTKDADRSELLLCPNGTVARLQDWQECYWGKTSTQKVFTKGDDASAILREDARNSLQKAADLFGKNKKFETVLQLFGNYFGTNDLIFDNEVLGLVDEVTVPAEQNEKESALNSQALGCKKQWHHPKLTSKVNVELSMWEGKF